MKSLGQIQRRHGKDRWKDAGFILIAALLIAVSVGAVTSKAAGKPSKHWILTVVESPVEIMK
jgi:hypothetical protein